MSLLPMIDSFTADISEKNMSGVKYFTLLDNATDVYLQP